MPNCFRLYPKGSTEAAVLQEVDAALCRHFGAEVDPVQWFIGWYHCIGWLIACKNGCALGSENLRREVAAWYDDAEAEQRREMLAILEYLETHYISDAWVEIGKR